MSQALHGNGVRANRDVRSRELAERQFAPASHTREAHLEQLDLSLGDSVAVSHFGARWGEDKANRRHHRLTGMTINPGARSVKCTVRDDREALMQGTWLRFNFVDQGDYWSGMFSVMPHAGLSYWTGGCTIAPDPADGMVQRRLSRSYSRQGPRGQVQIGSNGGGLLVERWSYAFLARSAYVSGVTGLAATAGNSTFTNVTQAAPGMRFRWALPDDPSSWTSQIIQITAAAAAPTGGGYSHPLSNTIPAGQTTCVIIDHVDEIGAVLYWSLVRTSDGLSWNDATSTWGGAVNNAMPNIASRWDRYVSNPITAPAGATTYTLTIKQATGGTVSRKNWVACAEIQARGFPHSAIVTDTFASTDPNPYASGAPTSSDQLSMSNKALVPGGVGSVLRHKRGTFVAKFKRNWHGTEGGVNQRFGQYGSVIEQSLAIRLYHDGTNDRWVAVMYDATASLTAIAVTQTFSGYDPTSAFDMLVAIRWASPTSDGGELDAKYGSAGAGTQQNFDVVAITGPNGVMAVANGTRPSQPPNVDNATIQFGNNDANEGLDAAFQLIGITDYVLSDAELLALARA